MKTKRCTLLAEFMAMLILISVACGLGTGDDDQEVAVAVALTQTAAIQEAPPPTEAPPATPVPTAVPTEPPTPTLAEVTPTPTSEADSTGDTLPVACQDNAVHLAGTGYYEPLFSEPSVAEVRMQNTGTCPWDSQYHLAFAGGDELPNLGPVYVQGTVEVGAETSFVVDFQAALLEAGTYQSVWQMFNADGVPFGEPVTFDVFVPLYNPHAFNAAESPQGLWIIDRYLFGPVSSWGEAEAEAQLGKTLTLQPEGITFDGQTCDLYPPDILFEDAASYLDYQYRTTPAALNLPDGSIDVIRTFCDMPGIYEFMRVQLPEGPVLVMNIEGVFFFLTPTDTRTIAGDTPSLSIDSFTVDVEDIPSGKRLTFNWQTSGASQVRIISGTSQRFPQGWDNLPPTGSHTVELPPATNYKHPQMILFASDAQGQGISQSVKANWPCQYEDHFRGDSTPAGTVCPASPPLYTPAAEQRFENGFMIWFSDLDNGTIFVFYDGGTWQQFSDTWQSGEPEFDPSLVPPASGLYQPVRGFGKVWRENQQVQDQLGWAVEEELAFDGIWQRDMAESPSSSRAHMVNRDFRLIRLNGPGSGTWEYRMSALD